MDRIGKTINVSYHLNSMADNSICAGTIVRCPSARVFTASLPTGERLGVNGYPVGRLELWDGIRPTQAVYREQNVCARNRAQHVANNSNQKYKIIAESKTPCSLADAKAKKLQPCIGKGQDYHRGGR